MCSSMKQPKPDRLVETDGIPMTVHSADGETTMNYYIVGGCRIIMRWIITFFLNYRITSSWCMILTWRVAPRLIVRGEDAKVATSYKVLIIHWKQRRGGWKKLRMEDNLKGEKEIFMSHKSWKWVETLKHKLALQLEVTWLYLAGVTYFDTVDRAVEEADASDAVQDGVAGVLQHVMCADRGLALSLSRKDGTLHYGEVLFVQHLGHIWQLSPKWYSLI